MQDKLGKFLSYIKSLKDKIINHQHHKLILGTFCIICLILVIVVPLYNVYSAEEPQFTQPVTKQVLGSESYGSVSKEGPYGNTSSPVKIAFILGEHPREWVAHKAVAEDVKENSGSLKYCYYLYYISVTSNANDYNKGRMNGQLLANKYVVPDIVNGDFRFAADIHGTDGEYSKKVFLFTPIQKGTSLEIAQNLSSSLSGVPYYFPASQTSPPYTTIPLIKQGVPAIVYESFKDLPFDQVKKQDKEFVLAVDNLRLDPNPCH